MVKTGYNITKQLTSNIKIRSEKLLLNQKIWQQKEQKKIHGN